MTRSLNRPDDGLGQGRGPNYPFLRPAGASPGPVGAQDAASAPPRMATSARAEAVEFLSSRARWPGVDSARVAAAERELDGMNQAERVFLEIDMASRRAVSHSADYDPLVWGRV